MTTIGVSGWMFLLVPARPGCRRWSPDSRETCVYVCVCVSDDTMWGYIYRLICFSTAICLWGHDCQCNVGGLPFPSFSLYETGASQSDHLNTTAVLTAIHCLSVQATSPLNSTIALLISSINHLPVIEKIQLYIPRCRCLNVLLIANNSCHLCKETGILADGSSRNQQAQLSNSKSIATMTVICN